MPFWVILIKYKYLLQSSGSQSIHTCHVCSVCWLTLYAIWVWKNQEFLLSSSPSLSPSMPFFPFHFHLRRHTLKTERGWWVFMGLIKTHFKIFRSVSCQAMCCTSFRRETYLLWNCKTTWFCEWWVSVWIRIEWFSEHLSKKKEKRKEIFLLCYKLGLGKVGETQYFNV